MLEELAALFEETGFQATGERRSAVMGPSILNRYLGGMVEIRVGKARPNLEDCPLPDAVLTIPYYHKAVSSMLTHREELERKFGLTLLQLYAQVLRSATENGRSPDALTGALVNKLGTDAA